MRVYFTRVFGAEIGQRRLLRAPPDEPRDFDPLRDDDRPNELNPPERLELPKEFQPVLRLPERPVEPRRRPVRLPYRFRP